MNAPLVLTIFLFSMAGYALLTDTLIMRGTYKQEDKPNLFWFGTAFYIVSSIASFMLYLKMP